MPGPLPDRFICAVPDDALAPTTPRGTRLIFDRQAPPVPGWGVLVQDGDGKRHVRRYVVASGDRWIGAASNPAYAALKSAEDRLEVLAVATGRFDGSV